MLFVTLLAIVFGLYSIAPGIGVVVTLLLLPVLVHTALLARREATLGHALGPAEKIALFFGSLGVVVVAGVSAAIAFFATCVAGFGVGIAAEDAVGAPGSDSIRWGFAVGVPLGGIVAAGIAYLVLLAASRSRGQVFSRRAKLFLAAAIILAAAGGVLWAFSSF